MDDPPRRGPAAPRDRAPEPPRRRGDAREALVERTFRVSRALLGDPLADALDFPPAPTLGLLAGMRARRRLRAALDRLSPSLAESRQAERTAFLLERAVLPGFDFRPPASHRSQETSPR